MIFIKNTSIDHNLCEQLDMSMSEYCFLDSIYQLSVNPKFKGFAIAKTYHYADFLNVSEKTIRRMKARFTGEGYIEKGKGSRMRTTQKYYDTVILRQIDKVKHNIFIQRFEDVWQFYPRKVQKERSLAAFMETIKNDQEWTDFRQALKNYKTSPEVLDGCKKNFFNFVRDYKDYLEVKV